MHHMRMVSLFDAVTHPDMVAYLPEVYRRVSYEMAPFRVTVEMYTGANHYTGAKMVAVRTIDAPEMLEGLLFLADDGEDGFTGIDWASVDFTQYDFDPEQVNTLYHFLVLGRFV